MPKRGKPRRAPEDGVRFQVPEPEASPLDARAVKLLLEVAEMSQAELARRSGVNLKALSRIATGKAALTREAAERLAAGLGLPTDAFGNARDFLLDMDQLRAIHVPLSVSGEAEAPEEVAGGDDEVAERAQRQIERERYLEDRRAVDSAAKAFRDLAMRFLSRGDGPPTEEP